MIIFAAIPVPLIMGAGVVYLFSWIYHFGKFNADKQFMNADMLQAQGYNFLASLARFCGHVYNLICYIFRIALFMAGTGIGWFIVLQIAGKFS